MPPGAYDPDAGAQAYQGMVDRVQYVEELGFDWVSVSEHHYSPRILTPNTAVSASYIAARSKKIKIAVLGPIVSQSNPVQVAEELAMLDNLSQGTLDRRDVARDDERISDLRPQSRRRRGSGPPRAWS